MDSRLNQLDDNYEKCYEKTHGCMTIANTFLLPQFTYIVSVLDTNDETYETINHFIMNFVIRGTSSNRNYWTHHDILYGPKSDRCLFFLFILENFLGE